MKIEYLSYFDCISLFVNALVKRRLPIRCVLLTRSFSRGDTLVGHGDVDLTIVTQDISVANIVQLIRSIQQEFRILKDINKDYANILSIPKISTYSDWFNCQSLKPAEFGFRDSYEGKILFGDNILDNPIDHLSDFKSDIRDCLITESIIGLGELSLYLLTNDKEPRSRPYWLWKSVINSIRYFIWFSLGIYLSGNKDVLGFARLLFGKQFDFLYSFNPTPDLDLEIFKNVYNFYSCICYLAIHTSNDPDLTKDDIYSKIEFLANFRLPTNGKKGSSFLHTTSQNWFWEPWLKPNMRRVFFLINEINISKSQLIEYIREIRRLCSTISQAINQNIFPIMIPKLLYQELVNNICPLMASQIAEQDVRFNINIEPNSKKLELWSKRTIAYFFFNWPNTFIQSSGAPNRLKILNRKILHTLLAFMYLRRKIIADDYDYDQIMKIFGREFRDFDLDLLNGIVLNGDIDLFPSLVVALRDYIYGDANKPPILYD